MEITAKIQGEDYQISAEAIDIAIPLQFNGPQPNTYGVPAATSQAFEGGGFVGDVRRGGSCNFESYTFVPHCNGTHTECIGHILKERISIHQQLKASWLAASLISLQPRIAHQTEDRYDPALAETDLVIDRALLESQQHILKAGFQEALIIRTLPNHPEKRAQDYMAKPPAFFTLEAMQWIVDLGVQHLLIDLPSVDRLFDEGKLRTHRLFWEVPAGQTELGTAPISLKTITEMVYVPDATEDGNYILNLQIAAFQSDAAPSRPRLFRISPTRTF